MSDTPVLVIPMWLGLLAVALIVLFAAATVISVAAWWAINEEVTRLRARTKLLQIDLYSSRGAELDGAYDLAMARFSSSQGQIDQ